MIFCHCFVFNLCRYGAGESFHVMDFVNIPISIVLGVILGVIVGFVLSLFFETAYAHKHCVRNSMKVIIVLGMAFLLMAIEHGLNHMCPYQDFWRWLLWHVY